MCVRVCFFWSVPFQRQKKRGIQYAALHLALLGRRDADKADFNAFHCGKDEMRNSMKPLVNKNWLLAIGSTVLRLFSEERKKNRTSIDQSGGAYRNSTPPIIACLGVHSLRAPLVWRRAFIGHRSRPRPFIGPPATALPPIASIRTIGARIAGR